MLCHADFTLTFQCNCLFFSGATTKVDLNDAQLRFATSWRAWAIPIHNTWGGGGAKGTKDSPKQTQFLTLQQPQEA